MRISLITSTLNRPGEMKQLLNSLANQRRPADQIVIVDQSDDDRTATVVAEFNDRLPLEYMKDKGRGLSRGRNVGLARISGDVVAFPDDDCVYAPDTLERVVNAFADAGLDFFTGMSVSPSGKPSQGRWSAQPHAIDKYNLWTSQTSYTTFYRSPIIEKIGLFDESLGVGAGTIWGAGEETEVMLRALSAGAKGRYDPALKIAHPEPLAVLDSAALDRGKRYNRGFGRVLKMGRYPLWFVAYMSGRPLIGAVAALARGDARQARYRYIAAKERILGWRD